MALLVEPPLALGLEEKSCLLPSYNNSTTAASAGQHKAAGKSSSMGNSFLALSEEALSPASSTEVTFLTHPKKTEALGTGLAMQLLGEDRKPIQSSSRNENSQLDFSSPTHILNLSVARPQTYNSISDSAPPKPTTSSSIYDTPFWRRYGFILVHLSMIVCQSCFAAVNVFGKYGLLYMHPIVLIILRNVGTLPFLMAGVALVERRDVRACLTWSNIIKCGAVGVLSMIVSQGLYVFGLQLTTATNSATLHLAVPVWTCVVCIVCGMEMYSLPKVLGIACSIAGAMVMVEVESFDLSGDMMVGNLLVLAMTLLFALYLVFCKPLVANMPPLNVSMWIFISASIFSIPMGMYFWREMWDAMHVTNSQAWLSIMLAVVVGTAIPYLIITWAIKQASPLVVAIYTPMELIATTMLAFVYLEEELSLRQLIGAICILTGLAVTTYAQQTEVKQTPTADIEEQPTAGSTRTSLEMPKSFTHGADISETTPLIAHTA